ncbi:molybdopterin-dependent oxidoreductase [Rhizobium sp. S152]|uniref:xanthine dehydrogenase family protein molybdopterin-binding subunit n=1 Tax=Rhizobium sp. S152 TaxID=3055038 RepID=UPI0025A9B95F|nr:molybdopterin cofactor-binding domain-containing protein [Rhizobium sp. S152]MDM9628491.1 molybdopterin-dependent oxidoreductase [Rhizobium sp. S152]
MTEAIADLNVLATRRSLLKGMSAAAFIIAFTTPTRAVWAQGQASDATNFNGFISIDRDNTVTAILAQTEGGQGNSTGMTQIIAAELGAAWPSMRYQFTTERRPEYINPVLYKGLILTAGSSSISGFFGTLRTAAATTREMLISAAAAQWAVATTECAAIDTFVVHLPSGKRLSFGDLAADAARLQMPTDVPLRSLAEMPLIGQPLSRLDAKLKVTGKARYGFDADVNEMLYAAVRHGRSYKSKVASIDDGLAKGMPGVRLVMAIPQGVAVVADHYWQAVKALAEVTETYEPHEHDRLSSEDINKSLRAALDKPGVATPGSHGDVVAGSKLVKTFIEGEFHLPILSHTCMEPVSCTASVVGDSCEVWLSTKSSTLDAGFAAAALGIDPATVILHNEFQGGDYGRRSGVEHVTEAVLLSRALQRPVKVVWTREEDLRIDQHRTSLLGRAKLGLGDNGMPLTYEAKIACDGLWQALFPTFYDAMKPLDLPMFSVVGSSYGIPNEAGSYVNVPHPVRIGAFRGNNESHNGFILETMIDEAAYTAKIDPLHYRTSLLANDQRSVAVLARAAELAKWHSPPADRYQGVAYHQSEFYGCRIATIVELSKSERGLRVERMFCACDSGLVINPNLARQNLEGGLLFGLSTVMHERITIRDGAPEQENFNDYRLLRINEAPQVDIDLIGVGEKPGSFGEIAVFQVGSALGNAIFKATGQRIRSQPFGAHGVTFA